MQENNPADLTQEGTCSLAGAPLDIVKLAAAVSMTIDHVNVVVLSHDLNALWMLGRVSYPLFALVLVCHLRRGVYNRRYLGILLVVGLISQPAYMISLRSWSANAVFTLAASGLLIVAMKHRSPTVPHVLFAGGALSVFGFGVALRELIDFGLAGVLFPVALSFALSGGRFHIIWLGAFCLGLNWYPNDPWQFLPIPAALVVAVGITLTVLLAVQFKSRARFLPRYAFHVFYPGHLILLTLLRAGAGEWT